MLQIMALALLAFQPVDDFAISTANRLALTPRLDGIIETEEWDALTEFQGVNSYLQWEPGSLYVAGRVPNGKSALISLDLNGDGWLSGGDNIEVLVSPSLRVRRLVESKQDGANWVSTNYLSDLVRVASANGNEFWSFETKILDTGIGEFKKGKTIGVRVEPVDPAAPEVAAFFPRRMQNVSLVMDRSFNLPEGVEWNPEFAARTVTPGQGIKLRLTFKNQGEINLGRIDLRTLGAAASFTSTKNLPFPGFDKKKRAFVDYEANVTAGAPIGYTLLNARVTREDGAESLIQSSYAISEVLQVEPKLKVEKGDIGAPRMISGDIILRSNTTNRLKGKLFLDVPTGWSVRRGNDSAVNIFNSRGISRQRVEIILPAGVQGLTPIPVRVQVGDRAVTQTVYVIVP